MTSGSDSLIDEQMAVGCFSQTNLDDLMQQMAMTSGDLRSSCPLSFDPLSPIDEQMTGCLPQSNLGGVKLQMMQKCSAEMTQNCSLSLLTLLVY